MYLYSAYGLNINSTFPLPELLGRKGGPTDLVIQRGTIGRALPETGYTGYYFHSTGEEAYLFWDEVGAFLAREGREIIVDALPRVDEQVLRLPLLGTVLSAAVQQRGFLALHASAVAIDGQAVAFLGPKGMGKSTLAAALYSRGHELISDDSLVIDISGAGTPVVLPGFPQLKLFPSAASELGYDAETLPRLVPGFEKRGCRANRFSRHPIPLRRMYVLDYGPSIEIGPLGAQETIVWLIGQSYMARIFKKSLQGIAAASHLFQCVDLARKVPLYRLKRLFSLKDLGDVARGVEADVKRSLTGACATL